MNVPAYIAEDLGVGGIVAKGLDLKKTSVNGSTVTIIVNGDKYSYKPTNGETAKEFAKHFISIARHSEGRAYAWLKKNAETEDSYRNHVPVKKASRKRVSTKKRKTTSRKKAIKESLLDVAFGDQTEIDEYFVSDVSRAMDLAASLERGDTFVVESGAEPYSFKLNYDFSSQRGSASFTLDNDVMAVTESGECPVGSITSDVAVLGEGESGFQVVINPTLDLDPRYRARFSKLPRLSEVRVFESWDGYGSALREAVGQYRENVGRVITSLDSVYEGREFYA